MSRYLIYGLVDPRTLLVRYVGMSSLGMKRPRMHRRASYLKTHTHRNFWIRALHRLGLDYEIVILEQVSSKDALPDLERFWIAYGRASGWPLTNHTDGGEGCPGRVISEATRAKFRGRAFSAETRAKIGAAVSAALTGRKLPPETIAKRTEKQRGIKRTPETLARMSAALKGRRLSPETIAKRQATRRANRLRKLSARQP